MELREKLNAGDEIAIQIAPFGEYPATTVDGREIVQRFDRDSFQRIVDDWKANGEKLIRADFDHASELTDNTVASGWIKDLAIDDEKGLVGTLVVSESGAEALNGLDYRFGSPVFAFDETEHPVSLLSFAFTNRPRLKEMAAVWNMDDKAAPEVKEEVAEVEVEERPEGEETAEVNKETGEKEKMEEIRKLLGLPEAATDEDIKNSILELLAKVNEIAEEEIAKEAEEAVNECGIDEEKKDEVINSYKQNPALVKTVLNAFRKAPVKLVVNSEEAKRPELTANEKLKNEYLAKKGGQEKVDFLLSHPGMKL